MKKLKSVSTIPLVIKVVLAVALVILAVSTLVLLWPKEASSTISYKDVQGIGYADNGNSLLIATDSGIYAYGKKGFTTLNTDNRQYYGFDVTARNIYTSGIALGEKDSPLGIIRSNNKGKVFNSIALDGKTYFQGLSVGYKTDVMYVFNPNKNSLMGDTGIYRSTDKGVSWSSINRKGLEGSIVSIEAHPLVKETLAVATSTGIYLSKDYGDTFTPLMSEENISAIHLNASGELVYAISGSSVELNQLNISNKKATSIPLPKIGHALIDFIETHPKRASELIIATTSETLYHTLNKGEKWEKLNKQ